MTRYEKKKNREKKGGARWNRRERRNGRMRGRERKKERKKVKPGGREKRVGPEDIGER